MDRKRGGAMPSGAICAQGGASGRFQGMMGPEGYLGYNSDPVIDKIVKELRRRGHRVYGPRRGFSPGGKMPYRMLVTDLDFTCLDEAHEIPEGNLLAVRRAIEEGIIFTVATGRGKAAADRIVRTLGPNAPVILQNGMNIYDFGAEKMISEHLIDTDVAIRSVIWAEERGFIPVLSMDDRHYVANRDHPRISALERLEGVPTVETGDLSGFLKDARESVRVANVLYICTEHERDALAAEASAAFPEVKVIVSGPPFVEFLNKDASKGHALREICEIMGIDLKDVVSVGDAPNDAEMLMESGMSYAVANAEEEIKRIAKKTAARTNSEAVLPEILWEAFGITV